MIQGWQQVLADWLKAPVQVGEVSVIRDWSESKVVKITALVDEELHSYYGKLARSHFATELAVCRLAGWTPSFPSPPGTCVEIEGETWLLLQDADGVQLARNQSPELYAKAFRALAAFHEQCLTDQPVELELLVSQVDRLADSVFDQVNEVIDSGIFTGVDLQLLDRVRVSLSGRFVKIRSLLAKYPLTLLHGDCHSGNLFLADENQLCLIDWGSAMLGPGLFDIVGLVDVARRMHESIGDVDHLLQLYWNNLSDSSRSAYGDLQRAWQVLRLCRSLLELHWFTRTGDDYGQRVNRELEIMEEVLLAV